MAFPPRKEGSAMRRFSVAAIAFLAVPAVAFAQPVTPQQHGGPRPGQVNSVGPDAGPANHPPRTDGPDAVNRGTDGSAVGLDRPAATGTTPQGFLGTSTAGARDPDKPPAGAPPPSTPSR